MAECDGLSMQFHLNGKITKSHRDGDVIFIEEFILNECWLDWDSTNSDTEQIPEDVDDMILPADAIKEKLDD